MLKQTSAFRRALERRGTAGDGPSAGEFIDLAKGFTSHVVMERDGYLQIVATNDATHRNLFVRDESKESVVLRRALKCMSGAGIKVRRRMFVDIGANSGTTTLAALNAGFDCVLACEPAPSSFRLLRASLALNGVEDHVVPIQVALSNRPGTGVLDADSRSRKARVLTEPAEATDRSVQQVQLARLDDLLTERDIDAGDIDVVFMDVEGHERHVLEGAGSILRRNVPLVMELNPRLLRLAGKLQELPRLLERHYTHLADLRRKPRLEPIERLPRLVDKLENKATDVLVCRLEH